ncbi:ryanodine receptor 2-like [Myxocyprinus asiaticus]|uniref:ryanodine receptor 2-like n=1 Tax=Myxocyprinus asiaticus TaxID=70543 RepID=UPI0022217A38|nr:ryanodine receptor 2-like [Myxocyprinus asiaticus]
MGKEEEELMIRGLGDIMNKVFYQHPNLKRALGMHETDMEVMVNVLGARESKVVQDLGGCGLHSCALLVSKGYPDIGWNPVEGKRYLVFRYGLVVEPDMSQLFCLDHKVAMVLFLDRVYGVEDQNFLLHLQECGFLPDL